MYKFCLSSLPPIGLGLVRMLIGFFFLGDGAVVSELK